MNRSLVVKLLSLFFCTAAFFFFSCKDAEIGGIKDVNPETVWFDYQVGGEEGSNDMTVMLQYRFAGENGTTLVLDAPSQVEFDGELIKGDSSKMTGAFYEVMKPLKEFTGSHTITFTDINKKQYREEFNFRPISLIAEVPKEIKRDDLVFELDGLNQQDYVRILLTDTAFTSEGINRLDTVKNGKIFISKKDLEKVVTGPVHFELIKEDEKLVKNGTSEGGRLSISYSIKREFVLTD